MNIPIPIWLYYTYAVSGLTIVLLIQYLLYRVVKSLYAPGNRAARRWLAVLLTANMPVALSMVYVFAGWLGKQPFLLKTYTSLFLSLSFVFTTYLYAIQALHRLYERWRTTRTSRPILKSRRNPERVQARLNRRRFLKKAVTGFSGMAAFGTFGGFSMARGLPVIERIELSLPDLPPTFDGMLIVQLSDFHAGPYMSRDQLQRIREMAEGLNPDLFVLTGDFADSHPDQVPDFVAALRDLNAPLGTFATLGNHDYYANVHAVEQGLAEARLPLLRNTHAIIENAGERIAIVGLDDRWAPRWGNDRGPDPAQAIRGLPAGVFKICLSHQPQLWPACRKYGMHLTLSGHTHGGQIGIPNTQISFARMVSPYVAGLYGHNGQLLYVNRGLGTVGLPLRIGVPPEITAIRLRRRNTHAVG
ncbi:MAG: metallophosphoesterase [candidate division KSB1 bacterium]|nr:metallophosphoesterase [candidate division KSB1 bacterium]